MNVILAAWVRDADARNQMQHFRCRQFPLNFGRLAQRADDFYLALLGELFSRLRTGYDDASNWVRLGNAFAQFADHNLKDQNDGVNAAEAALYSAFAFFIGGYSASARVVLRGAAPYGRSDIHLACYDLLARPASVHSTMIADLIQALRAGDSSRVRQFLDAATNREQESLAEGPDAWVVSKMYRHLLEKFLQTNVRAVLPNGDSAEWNGLVDSFLSDRPQVWDFFPSQIQAVSQGLLESNESFSLQMPTGSGKTALCETLIYSHLIQNPQHVAVLIVPYRALAAELRNSLVRRMNAMGFSAWSAYGGTVPSSKEVSDLQRTRVLVATPETLSALLSADADFLSRLSLVVCDEGHLLDSQARGVHLELLLARLRMRDSGSPRFVFVSAIVPNIEEINRWLGGTTETVVRSDFRSSIPDFAYIKQSGSGVDASISLKLHPQEREEFQYSVTDFLTRADFQYPGARRNSQKTYTFAGNIKTQAVAAARKALSMGATAIFCANKGGDRGAIGVAQELLKQLTCNLSLRQPNEFTRPEVLAPAVEYLRAEYGDYWIGAQTLAAGAVLHHGDIPQESREVLEELVRNEQVRLVICTSTLAEGVNLPLRSIVLYSVRRSDDKGKLEKLLSRDIKNLVGRAGRAGAATKALVICANSDEWEQVLPVAKGETGESVKGALFKLLNTLYIELLLSPEELSLEQLERRADLQALVDGIDDALIDLALEERSADDLSALASNVADSTYASQQAPEHSKSLLRQVFQMRAVRVTLQRDSGRLRWIKQSGCKLRMIAPIEENLMPRFEGWSSVDDPLEPDLLRAMMEWAWEQPEAEAAVGRVSWPLPNKQRGRVTLETGILIATQWMAGASFKEIARSTAVPIDSLLQYFTAVHGQVLQSLIDQGIALLKHIFEERNETLAPAIQTFGDLFRFGAQSSASVILAKSGIRHRRAHA